MDSQLVPKKKNLLFLYSKTGGGHKAVANALMASIERQYPNQFNLQLVDFFEYSSKFLNLFAKSYGPVIRYIPKFWGYTFNKVSNIKNISKLFKLSKLIIRKSMPKMLEEFAPDAIISVHPLVNHLTTYFLEKENHQIPFYIVVTDPITVHPTWLACNDYISVGGSTKLAYVATEEAKTMAVQCGFPEEKLQVMGLPIEEKFTSTERQSKSDKFTVLLMGGADGAGKISTIVKEFSKQNFQGKLIVICGKNTILVNKLNLIKSTLNLDLEIHGFSDQVEKIMAESDLIITKAGPSSIAESLAMGLPMIIYFFVPGQEEGNIEFVIKNKLGFYITSPQNIVKKTIELQNSNSINEMSKLCLRFAKPKAASEISKSIIDNFTK